MTLYRLSWVRDMNGGFHAERQDMQGKDDFRDDTPLEGTRGSRYRHTRPDLAKSRERWMSQTKFLRMIEDVVCEASAETPGATDEVFLDMCEYLARELFLSRNYDMAVAMFEHLTDYTAEWDNPLGKNRSTVTPRDYLLNLAESAFVVAVMERAQELVAEDNSFERPA